MSYLGLVPGARLTERIDNFIQSYRPIVKLRAVSIKIKGCQSGHLLVASEKSRERPYACVLMGEG